MSIQQIRRRTVAGSKQLYKQQQEEQLMKEICAFFDFLQIQLSTLWNRWEHNTRMPKLERFFQVFKDGLAVQFDKLVSQRLQRELRKTY